MILKIEMNDTKIEDLLECPVCLEQLNEKSRVLPCQHTICLACLYIVVGSKTYLQCPECRTDYADLPIESLPRNVLLVRILEGIRNSKINYSNKGTTKRLSAKVKYEALSNQPCARGLYNFNSTEEGDLPFRKGDVVTLVREIDDNWLDGVLKGKRGSIPKNFVEILVPIPKIEDKSVKTPFAKALYSYESKDETEILSFREGDIIGVIKKVDGKWLEGILGGQYGIFPVNFVQLNNAATKVMLVNDSNNSSGSSSDEESYAKKKKRQSKQHRAKLIKQNTTPASPWVKLEEGDCCQKRNTIHIENPSEDERRIVNENIDDDFRTRKRSVSASSTCGRRVSDQQDSRSLANTAIINNAIRTSNEKVSQLRSSNEQMSVQSSDANSLQSVTNSATSSLQSVTNSTASSSLQLVIPPSGSPPTTSIGSRSPTNSVSPIGFEDMFTALFTYTPCHDDELALIQGEQYCVVEKHIDGWYRGFHVRSRQNGVFPGNYVKPTSQVTPQILCPAMTSYGSNPASPITNSTGFNFPPPSRSQPIDTIEATNASATISGSPSRSSGGMSGILKILKKNKHKRVQPPTQIPPTPVQTSVPISTTSQFPPSYHHSSMPVHAHHRLSRPMPLVPVEPPPPYTPTPFSHCMIPPNEPANIINTSITTIGEKFRAIATFPGSHEDELSFRIYDVIYVMKKRLDGWYRGKCERTGSTGVFPSTFVEAML